MVTRFSSCLIGLWSWDSNDLPNRQALWPRDLVDRQNLVNSHIMLFGDGVKNITFLHRVLDIGRRFGYRRGGGSRRAGGLGLARGGGHGCVGGWRAGSSRRAGGLGLARGGRSDNCWRCT